MKNEFKTKELQVGLIRNAIRTPDGTVLESRYRWDYVSHIDKNGKTYFTDGGLDYCRRSIHEDQECLNVYSDDDHFVIREVLTWGTKGKDGKQPYREILLKDMEDDHIVNCLITQDHMYPTTRKAMIDELQYRGIEADGF